MGRIFVLVGGLLVLLLTAALVVPPFVDWSGYRAEFEREAGIILGRPVQVTGDVHVRLLPFPSLEFTDVKVGEDTAHPTMSVDTFSLDAELMPFLRGQLLIYDMRVERPRVNIVVDRDGKVDWAIRPSTPINPAQIKVERLSINDGAVFIHDEASGRSYEMDAIDAVLSATRLSGPWHANGTANLAGQRVAIGVSSGELKPDGALRLRIRLTPDDIPAMIETDGDMTLEDGRLHYAGDFSLRSADLLADNNNKVVTEKPFFSDVRLSGKFSADKNQINASEFRMEQGPADNPYVVNGKAVIDFGDSPHFEINADGQQIFWGPAEGETDEQDADAVPLTDRLALAHKMLEQLPIPGIPGSVDLRLPAIIAGGTTMRTVAVSAEPDEDGWIIRQFAADLPGRTKVEAQGKLTVGEEFGFVGEMLVASRQPSGLASWLNESVDESIRKLEAAGFSGKVNLRNGLQRIDDLEIGLGKTKLTGSFIREVSGNAEPSIRFDLNGGETDSDALKALTGFFLGRQGLTYLEGQALTLGFRAGPVHYEDMVAESVDLALRLNNGIFDFDRLMITNVAGATLTATGTYEPYAATPSGTLDATLLSEDLKPFVTMMAHRHPEVPLFRTLSARGDNYQGLFENSEINIIANGAGPHAEKDLAGQADSAANDKGTRPEPRIKAAATGGEFSYSLSGKFGGMRFDLSGTANGGNANAEPMQMQLNGTATSDNGEVVLALLGLPTLPLGLAGELTADLTMQGAPSAGMRTQLKLSAPDGSAVADGILTLVGGELAASGKGHIKAADLQPFIATAGYVLPGFGEGLSADVSSDFQFAKGQLRFPNFSGTLGGENITARIEANFADSGLPLIRGEAKLDSLQLGSLAAIMLGQDAINTSGSGTKSVWPETSFAARSSLPLLIDMNLNVAQLELGRFGQVSEFSSRLQKTIDSLSLNEATGNWAGGYVIGNASLRNNDSVALLNSDLKWNGADLANLYSPDGQAPLSGVLNTELSLNGTGHNMAELVGSLTGSGKVNVENLIVRGLDQSAFSQMLAETDRLGDRPEGASALNAGQFVAIAEQATGKGAVNAGNAAFDFTIVGGIVRFNPFILEGSQTLVSGDLQVDLSSFGLGGGGSFTYKDTGSQQAGNPPMVGYTLSGSYENPVVELNYEPLAQFLTQRALEREQERVEAMQANIMEKQQLRRQLELLQEESVERDQRIKEDEARRRFESGERVRILQKAHEDEQQRALEREALKTREEAQQPPSEAIGQSIEDFIKGLESQSESEPSIEP